MCEIGRIKFQNCVWNAPVPATLKQLREISLSDAGAVVFKTITLNPRQGEPDNWCLFDEGSKNSVKLHNNGLEHFIKELYELGTNKPVFISIYEQDCKESLLKMISRLNELENTLLIEWNISCPNVDDFIPNEDLLQEIKKSSIHPLGIKINYDQSLNKEVLSLLKYVDFVTAINTIAGYGGKMIFNKAVETIKRLHKITDISIIGVGGVETWRDVEIFLSSGATAVEIGTSFLRYGTKVFSKPKSRQKIINSLFEEKIIKEGNFKLKNGEETNFYFDMRMLPSLPKLWNKILLLALKKVQNLDFDLVCGVPSGAVPLATMIAQYTKKPLIMCRDKPKKYGGKKWIEGSFKKKQKVLLVEDVITTGESVLNIKNILQEHKLLINDVLCLIKRRKKNCLNLKLHSVFHPEELNPCKTLYTPHEKILQLEEIIKVKRTRVCFSADITDEKVLFELLNKIGPYICLVKFHSDMIDFTDTFAFQLHCLKNKHNFMVMEDRKLFDVGNTIQKQTENICKIYTPDFITAFYSENITKNIPKNIGIILIAQLSSQELGSLYTQKVVEYSLEHPVCGIVSQEKLDSDLFHLVPGIHENIINDGKNQRYRTPDQVKGIADVIIVGRGIYEANDPVEAIKRYRNYDKDERHSDYN